MTKPNRPQLTDFCIGVCLWFALFGTGSATLADDQVIAGDRPMPCALANRGKLILDDNGPLDHPVPEGNGMIAVDRYFIDGASR